MTNRIFRFNIICTLAAVALTALLVLCVVFSVFDENQKAIQQDDARIMAATMDVMDDELTYLAGMGSIRTRVTLIDPTGRVLYDNHADPDTMEDHSQRPEFLQALETGTGESQRDSFTIGQTTYYYAVRLNDGNVLRLANATRNGWGVLMGIAQPLTFILLLLAIATFMAARAAAKLIVQPINELDLAHPMKNKTYEELTPLLRRMDRQNKALAESMKELSRRQREFNAVTVNMTEGMIILNARGTVIGINKAAAEIFFVGEGCTGQPLSAVCTNPTLNSACEKAQKGEASEELITLNGHEYQLLSNPVWADSVIKGAVLLILDVTAKMSAERERREFTANVSHELKTPLTSIMGYAEIMRSGLAREQDTKEFSGRIYDESTRLLSLVEDIMRLSQLDERANLPQFMPVQLGTLCKRVADTLRPLAARKELTLKVSGEDLCVSAVQKVLYDTVHNLIENAIKYNVPHGSVEVNVGLRGERPVIEVKDTGMGIPKADQPHIFERFYRVDKSHSRETGGNGLGLAIVKHGARLHDAELELESEEGKGTTIRVVFPLPQ